MHRLLIIPQYIVFLLLSSRQQISTIFMSNVFYHCIRSHAKATLRLIGPAARALKRATAFQVMLGSADIMCVSVFI